MKRILILLVIFCGALQAAECIAHRGDSIRHPDNTLKAIASAWKAGADVVEVDVRMTGDGALVLFHDADWKKESIKDMTHAQLDAKVKDHAVPTLVQCLKSAEAGQHLLLDLKERSAPFLRKVLAEVGEFTPSGCRVNLQSTDLKALSALRKEAPKEMALFYVTNLKNEPGAAELADQLALRGVQGITAQGRDHVDKGYVAAFQRKGLKYFVWTINPPDRIQHYVGLGVDGVITDDPATFRKLVPRAKQPKKALPFPGEVFSVAGHTAFLILPGADKRKPPIPWVWYAPTLPRLPGKQESWMFEQWLAQGIAIAGIDVGESYGSPKGTEGYSALYAELTGNRGLAAKPCLLARSRGGLMLYNWAAENPGKVSGVAGIYPVCNLVSYPGLARACAAYDLSKQGLADALARHNPVNRLKSLAEAKVPLFHLHGDADKLVPLAANSGMLKENYTTWGGPMTLEVIKGGRHDVKPHWFTSQKLVDFVSFHATGGRAIQGDKALRKRLLDSISSESTWEIEE